MYVGARACACIHATTQVWRSENNLEFLDFYHLGLVSNAGQQALLQVPLHSEPSHGTPGLYV